MSEHENEQVDLAPESGEVLAERIAAKVRESIKNSTSSAPPTTQTSEEEIAALADIIDQHIDQAVKNHLKTQEPPEQQLDTYLKESIKRNPVEGLGEFFQASEELKRERQQSEDSE